MKNYKRAILAICAFFAAQTYYLSAAQIDASEINIVQLIELFKSSDVDLKTLLSIQIDEDYTALMETSKDYEQGEKVYWTKLDLSAARLQSLLGKSIKLNSLDGLTRLLQAIGLGDMLGENITKLNEIDLSGNALTKLDPRMADAYAFNASNNNISDVSAKNLRRLRNTNLLFLDLRGNPLTPNAIKILKETDSTSDDWTTRVLFDQNQS